jgi:hypothetical protein
MGRCELQLHHDSHQRVIKTTAPAKIARQAMTENAIMIERSDSVDSTACRLSKSAQLQTALMLQNPLQERRVQLPAFFLKFPRSSPSNVLSA